ncbi:MAG: hypothetical protein ACK2UX_20930 [Anaerolineae bacterium]
MGIRDTYLRFLSDDVERNLERFDEETGRFLTGDGWAVTKQDIVYPLALLYTTAGTPYYGDDRILHCALRGADAWRDFQYPDGRVEFVKVDGSRWGPTYMPWSMYHWLETYALLRDRLDPARRARWEEGLTLAYDGIANELAEGHVHNIPTWKGMAAYRAGALFDRPDWQDAGAHMIALAVDAQTPHGYWIEHHGPTTLYNLVYTHAIGLYHVFSGDDSVLPCLERATDFHIRYTYPDGRIVETIDGRVKYHDRVSDFAHTTFSLFPQGRRYVRMLVEQMEADRQADVEPRVSYVMTSGSLRIASAEYGLSPRLASACVHLRSGPEGPIPQDQPAYQIHDPGHSLIRRGQGWFYCLSGITTPPVESRWGQDRGNYVSIWNEETGLIVGGGNSKDQPEWSTFAIGSGTNASHLPVAAALRPGDREDAVALTYDVPARDEASNASATCVMGLRIVNPESLEIHLTGPVEAQAEAHLTLKLNSEHPLHTGAGATLAPDGPPIDIASDESGGWIGWGKWCLTVPAGSRFQWPVLPFNPYAADGAAPLDEAAGVLTVPLNAAETRVLYLSVKEETSTCL